MRVPVIVFINKIDRVGARDRELLGEIRRTLGFVTVPLSWPVDPGSVRARVRPVDPLAPEWREATIEALASNSDTFLARYVRDDGDIPDARVRTELARQARRGDVVPVLFGSAVLGVGVDLLLGAIPRYLPFASGRADAPLSASVFKVQRAANGERVVLARLHAGCLRRRDVVTLGGAGASDATRSARVTAIERFDDGRVSTVESATGGEIVRLHGLREARIGDVIGEAPPRSAPRFDPPTLESVVRLAGSGRPGDLAAALQHLADLDPLIGLRVSPRTGELSVRLYGEVQKEVIAATLGREYGLDVRFEPSQVVCIEVPCGTGEAVERIDEPGTPFAATVGVRVEQRPTGHGVTVSRPSGALDLSFYRAIEETIVATLAEGLCGWAVTDCHVTVTETAMWPTSVASDYRNLTPLVLMAALGRAGTEVREPVQRFGLDAPVSLLGTLIDRLVIARAALAETDVTGDRARVSGTIPSAELHRFEERLPGLTGGDAGFWSEFAGYRPVSGEPPRRARTDLNPLDRVSYLAAIAQGQTA